LISLHAVPDLPRQVQEHLYFVRFEDLMTQPVACMSHLYDWLGVSPLSINPAQLQVGPQESDSHYHMKYSHKQASQITAPKRHEIPPRIQALIESAYAWYYQLYYPKLPTRT
jgi:sulfotransferase